MPSFHATYRVKVLCGYFVGLPQANKSQEIKLFQRKDCLGKDIHQID
uniref:Uncharacterized protein n=1 Tax=Picea sitchensis TaxID=3332 RepID=D5ADP5_PICSI|nr:unknown [Picea sitchensis]